MSIRIALAPDIVACAARGILHVAPCFLGLALDLLRSALDLGACVAGPFTDLALGPSGNIVDSAGPTHLNCYMNA